LPIRVDDREAVLACGHSIKKVEVVLRIELRHRFSQGQKGTQTAGRIHLIFLGDFNSQVEADIGVLIKFEKRIDSPLLPISSRDSPDDLSSTDEKIQRIGH
jgi:hypothetical protein